MPQLPRQENQEVFSQGDLGYRSDQVNPAAFGSTVGPALQQAGNTASDIALTRQGLWNEKAATDGVTALANKLDDITTSYRSKLGQNAVTSYDDTKAQLNQSLSDVRSTLNPAAARMFDFQASRILRGSLNETDSHWDQQFKQSMVDTNNARVAAAARTGALNYNDPQRVAENLAITAGEVQKRGEFLGLTPEAMAQEQDKERSTYLGGVVQSALEDKDIHSAEAIMAQYKDALDPKVYKQMQAAVKQTQEAGYVDQEHAYVMQERARKENDLSLGNQWMTGLHDGTLTADAIIKSSGSWELKHQFIDMMKTNDRQENTKSDPATFHALADQILTGDMPDEKPLRQAFINNNLNFEDLGKLEKRLAESRTPEGSTLMATRKRFEDEYMRIVDKSTIGNPDPAGGVNRYEYNAYIDQKISEYKKAGKDPNDLFLPNQNNKDFVGNAAPLFQRTPKQISDAQIAAMKAGNQKPIEIKKAQVAAMQPAQKGKAPPAAEAMVIANPALKDQFKAKYGYLPDDLK